MSNSSDELRWRVGRANSGPSIDAVTRTRWLRSHCADEHKEKTMKNAQTFAALLAIVVFCSLPSFGGSLEPLTVSPGATDRITGVEVRCPTFSWQAVPGALGYEVVVYELPL